MVILIWIINVATMLIIGCIWQNYITSWILQKRNYLSWHLVEEQIKIGMGTNGSDLSEKFGTHCRLLPWNELQNNDVNTNRMIIEKIVKEKTIGSLFHGKNRWVMCDKSNFVEYESLMNSIVFDGVKNALWWGYIWWKLVRMGGLQERVESFGKVLPLNKYMYATKG